MITSPKNRRAPLSWRGDVIHACASLNRPGANTLISPGIAQPDTGLPAGALTASLDDGDALPATEPSEGELGVFPSGAGRELPEVTAEHDQHPNLPIAGGGLGRLDRWDQRRSVVLRGDPLVRLDADDRYRKAQNASEHDDVLG